MLHSLDKILDVTDSGYFMSDEDYEVYSFKGQGPSHLVDNPHILKGGVDKDGYLQYCFRVNKKRKTVKKHKIVVLLFIDPNFDSNTHQIDHINHNKLDNRIENLKVVNNSLNQFNKSKNKGIIYEFIDSLEGLNKVRPDHDIYYSSVTNKFYRYIEHTKQYRSFKECKHYSHMQISYIHEGKSYTLNTTKFRESLSN